MQNITLQLSDEQYDTLIYLMDSQVINNPRIDFNDWLQIRFDETINALLPLKDQHIRDIKLGKAYQMVELDIVDKMQEIIDIVKLDPTADYDVTPKPKEDPKDPEVIDEEVIP